MWDEFTGVVDELPERGGFIARCLERPGTRGHGRTADEALRRLAEGLARVLAERGDDFAPDRPRRRSATSLTVH